jgi:hypothetical protein
MKGNIVMVEFFFLPPLFSPSLLYPAPLSPLYLAPLSPLLFFLSLSF